jgi:hypothetical protein
MSSISSYNRNTKGVSILSDKTHEAVTSGFLKNYGNYIGGTLSLLWTGLAIYSLYIIYKLDKTKEPYKNYYWAGPGITLLIVLSANIYYFRAKNKINKQDELSSIRSIYANISLIPIYLIIVGIGLLFLFNVK